MPLWQGEKNCTVYWSPPSIYLSAVTVMFHLMPCKYIWAMIVFLFIMLFKTIQISAISLLIWARIVFSCAVPVWKLSPSPCWVSLGLYWLQCVPRRWREGGHLCTALKTGLCCGCVRVVLLWIWHPHKCSGTLDSYLTWFDQLYSPGGGLSSDALQSVWFVPWWRMLQPLMFFRLVTIHDAVPDLKWSPTLLTYVLHLILHCNKAGCSWTWCFQQPRSGCLEQVPPVTFTIPTINFYPFQ